jgi:hypothetical protein
VLRWLPLVLTVVLVHVAPTIAAQQAATQAGTLQRRYTGGAVSHCLMTGNNDGWQYTIQATDVVKRDTNGRYYEEIGWSDLTSNAQQALTPASLALRQTVSLDDPASYMRVPNLANVQPLLIGPITDTLTSIAISCWLCRQSLCSQGRPRMYRALLPIPGPTDNVSCSAKTWLISRSK